MTEPTPAATSALTSTQTAVCVDFGSTWTKALHVDLATGDLLGTASSPTRLPPEADIMTAYDDCLAVLAEQDARAATAATFACSSAGGGLRIAVVGNEELVTAEAGRRVALTSGGRVVAVVGRAAEDALDRVLDATDPDLVLLTGGTDGGNSEILLTAARDLAELAANGVWRGPVVVAGNVAARTEVAEILAGVPHVHADNVVPRIGELAPHSARAAVREAFLAHVIGGKQLSARPEFLDMVVGPTPDVVLTGVELLARLVGDVVVVDIGGATTDVHSVVQPDPEEASLHQEVVAVTAATRTVEGDLGMRWSAPSTVESARLKELADAARRRHDTPGWLPTSEAERADETRIAHAAAEIALRRHAGRARAMMEPPVGAARPGKVIERSGVDLRRVRLVIGSGGVLRHGGPRLVERVLTWDAAGGWLLPEAPTVRIDGDYVLAAIGLLAPTHPDAARRLARRLAPAPVASSS